MARIDWEAERERYVTGTETTTEMAARLGVNRTSLEKQAGRKRERGGKPCGKSWGELRAEHRAKVAAAAQKKVGEQQVTSLAALREKTSRVVAKALDVLDRRLEKAEAEKTADLVQIAKLGAPQKIELGGNPDGSPIDVRTKLDGLSTEDLLAIAARKRD